MRSTSAWVARRVVVCLVTALAALTTTGTSGEGTPQGEAGDLAIYGTVMQPGTREPVGGVQVLIGGPDRSGFDEEYTVVVTSDTQGRFRLSGLTPGEYEVSTYFPEESGRGSGISLPRRGVVA